MFTPLYQILGGSAAVRGYIGTPPAMRAYPHGRAADKAAYPYVTWRAVSGIPETTLSEDPVVDQERIQVDCWTENSGVGASQIKDFAKAVRRAIEPFYNVLSYAQSDGPDPTTGSYRVTFDIIVWADRDLES